MKKSRKEKKSIWDIVAAIAGMIAAIAAAIAVWQAWKISSIQIAAQRPYIQVRARYAPAVIGYGFELTVFMKNIGGRPANNLTCIVVRLSGSPNPVPFEIKSETIVNEIPPGEEPTLRHKIENLKPDNEPEFVVIEVRFNDSIMNDDYINRHYLVWKGAQDGEALQALAHAAPHQIEALDKGFEKALKKLTMDKEN